MTPTPNHLAQLLRSLVATGQAGGPLQDRWSLRDLIVAAGLPSDQAETAIAEAFPFPSTADEAYSAGTAWGSNYAVAEWDYRDFDEEGRLLPVQLQLKVPQNPKWINRFLTPLRIAEPVLEKEGWLPLWVDFNPDEVLGSSLRLLGVGSAALNWELVPRKLWTPFIAGVIDSTPIVLAGGFNKEHEGFNRQVHDQELILNAGEFALARAICGGIEGAKLCSSHPKTDQLLVDHHGPFGVTLTGKAIPWFFNEVRYWLHYSVLREEKDKAAQFDSPNKNKKNTGVRLTQGQKKELQRWALSAHRNRIEVTSVLLCQIAEGQIGRSISMVTAWNILRDFDWWLDHNHRGTRK